MDLRELIEAVYRKELLVAVRSGEKIPYAEDGAGRFDDKSGDICWWTNGFWAGLLWQLYAYRRNALFRRTAERIEKKLDRNFLSAAGMDHDSGFKWLLTAGADLQLTGSEKSKNRLLLAANDLAGRFNPAGGFLRAWNDETGEKAGWAIIDCMMNLPLLYRAGKLTRDPRFSAIALRHAETARRYLIREDGSARHIAVFDPATGAFSEELGGQGMGRGSSWSRGQAWAIYGFTLSYLHTGRRAFLRTAERCADRFLSLLPASGLVPADLCQPADCPYEDGSAAAIAACGLFELSRATGKGKYRAASRTLLETLAGKRCDFSPARDGLLTHCSVAYQGGEHNIALIYGDYFFTEAVLKFLDKEIFLW